jgi:hypothetical protein
MLERLKNWKTTIAGLGVTAVLLVFFKSFNCELPNDWMVWAVSTLPAAFGALSKD